MKESDFDKSIRNMMESYGETPEPSSWISIEKSLSSGRRRVIFVRSFSAVAAVAAAVALFFIIGREEIKTPLNGPAEQIAVIEAGPEKIADEPEVSVIKAGKLITEPTESIIDPVKTISELVVVKEENQPNEADQTELVQTEKENEKAKENTNENSKEKETAQRIEKSDFTKSDFPIEVQIKSRRRKPSLALSTLLTPGVGNNERILNTYMQTDFMQFTSSLDREQSQIETVYDTRYLPAVSVGLQLILPLNRVFSLGTGLNYTMLYSTTEEQRFNETVTREHTLHYIGLPVFLYANIFSNEKLILYGGAGATIEKGLAERVKRNGVLPVDETNPVSGFQWSAGATIGGEYRLGKHMGLYADPMLVYYFKGNQPKSIRSAQPLQFKLELGLRYRF